jgi:hypothetical protein
MSLLSRLFSRNAMPEPLIDEVRCNEKSITRRHPDGRIEQLDWDELREIAVMIHVDERGRSGSRIVLTGRKTGLIFGAYIDGGKAVVARIRQLPGFMAEVFDQAMASRTKARIVCWRPPGMPTHVVERTGMGQRVPATAPAPTPAPATPRTGGYLRLDIAPDHRSVAGYAEDTIRNMQRVYQVEMDWSLESLAHIDRVLGEWHAGGAPMEKVNKSLYSMGSYAGQVLLRLAPGRWVDPSDDDEQVEEMDDIFLMVELDNGRTWRPIALCIAALNEGPRHSLLRSARALLAAAPQGKV